MNLNPYWIYYRGDDELNLQECRLEGSMRRLIRRALWSIGAGLFVVTLLLVWGMVSRTIPGTLSPPTGPYAVGRMEFDWIDQSRPDPFVSGKQNRELDVFVWYP